MFLCVCVPTSKFLIWSADVIINLRIRSAIYDGQRAIIASGEGRLMIYQNL